MVSDFPITVEKKIHCIVHEKRSLSRNMWKKSEYYLVKMYFYDWSVMMIQRTFTIILVHKCIDLYADVASQCEF